MHYYYFLILTRAWFYQVTDIYFLYCVFHVFIFYNGLLQQFCLLNKTMSFAIDVFQNERNIGAFLESNHDKFFGKQLNLCLPTLRL